MHVFSEGWWKISLLALPVGNTAKMIISSKTFRENGSEVTAILVDKRAPGASIDLSIVLSDFYKLTQ